MKLEFLYIDESYKSILEEKGPTCYSEIKKDGLFIISYEETGYNDKAAKILSGTYQQFQKNLDPKKFFTINNEAGEYFNQNLYPLCNKFERLLRQVLCIASVNSNNSKSLKSCKKLEKMGFEVTYLPVDETGLVDIAELIHCMNQKTILVSVMAANNEIGTIQNLKTISKLAHEKDILFHTDAVQALGGFKIDVKDLDVDAMSISGHKIHAPKGIGALYLRKGVKIDNLIVGGNQEKGKRGGTLNLASIVGFGKAVETTVRDYTITNKKLKTLRDYFVSRVKEEIQHISVNGHHAQRLPGLASISFNLIEGESLMLLLDMAGIAVSTGSACSSGTLESSHVLKAIGLPPEEAQGTIRFSFGTNNTKEEIDYVVETLKKNVAKLREMSPLRAKRKKK